ncbi:MAG: hypothetical protein E7342_02230 [Clostridiales bacterium]|nr:hypothetical protein [Clostridiales bacterium]
MKKITKWITLILAVVLSASVLGGCTLVTIDNDRDMNQVIATVQIDENAPLDKIYKKDMIIDYYSYGYSSVQQGSSITEVFETILENLVKTRVLVQSGLAYLNENGLTVDTTKGVYDPDRYLDDKEQAEILYDTNKNINENIESYLEEEEHDHEHDHGDTLDYEKRTAPTDAKNFEKELEKTDFDEYNTKEGSLNGKGVMTGFVIENGVIKSTDSKLRKAYNEFIKNLENNGFLVADGETFDFEKDTVYDTYFYEYLLKTNKESAILEKYSENLSKDYAKDINFKALEEKYEEMYNAQVNKFETETAYVEALGTQSASAPIVYNPYSGYGYVYNLLLGVDDVQTTDISKINSDTSLTATEKAEQREEVLSKTIVKDLRSSWILDGYDFDYETKSFTGDYKFSKDGIPFKGEVNWVNEDEKDENDEDYEEKYEIDEVFSYSLKEFIDFMDTFLYGEKQTGEATDYYKMVKVDTEVDEYEEKINDLLFAFSTDPGSLNTYKGYAVGPEAKGPFDTDSKYVKEFTKAGASLLELGGSSYIIVATDYGYHVMFYSEKINANANFPTLVEYLNSIAGEFGLEEKDQVGWEKYYNEEIVGNLADYGDSELKDFYLYVFSQVYTKAYLSEKVGDYTAKLVFDLEAKDGAIVKFEDRYADLLGK